LAPVILDLRAHPEQFRTTVVATGQHREILDQALSLFGIEPDDDLGVMTRRQTLDQITIRILKGMREVLERLGPDVVLVEGDTTTVLAAGLAAFYAKIAVGHVEAGLRTEDRYNPFPEEMNRRLAGSLAEMHFAPTPAARENLLAEGVDPRRIFVTGNTVVDALRDMARRPAPLPEKIEAALAEPGARLLLVTAHRRENWGRPLQEICRALRDLAARHPEARIVYGVHPNPVVRDTARAILGRTPRVHLLDFPPYSVFVSLLQRADLVLTDSGGVQEEAPALGKPTLVLRTNTERPEGVAAGVAKLVGTQRGTIVREASRLLEDRRAYAKMARAANPYGDGRAAARIRRAIRYHLGRQARRPADFAPR
jgi:UDP-N-acetylglucosamine 2-epimerase (non-hydrolysing)